MPGGSLEARIYEAYPGLSPTEKRLADILLEYQMELPSYTAGELAEKAAVSKSTAARLIRALGYDSYPDAKRRIREDQHWGSPQGGIERIDKEADNQVSAARMMQSDLDNIHRTIMSLDANDLDAAAEAMAKARRVWILGMRSGYGLAHHAAHYLSILRPDVQVLPTGGGSYSHDIASIREDDVLFVISFRRRPKLLPDLLKEVGAIGATTVLITDLSAAASARSSRYVFKCHCHTPAPFNSFSAAVTIINYLAWRVSSLLRKDGIDRFQRIDHLVEVLDSVSTPQHDPQRR